MGKITLADDEHISYWWDEGVKKGALYMVIILFRDDNEDDYVYYYTKEACQQDLDIFDETYTFVGDEGEEVLMEVYDLQGDKVEQIKTPRVFAMLPAACQADPLRIVT